ncbi:hypothetical protein ACLB2K_075233 [Fragaria x ananassa]
MGSTSVVDVNVQGFREAALAYFSNLPQTNKGAASSSSTSNAAVKRFLKKFFDTNGDGKLDYDGFITFYYFKKSGRTKLMREGGHGIDPMMEKIRSTAFAYYENLSSDNKQKALEFIREMNIDGVSWAISLQQYENKFGSSSRMKKCFDVVDRNRDGWLDFPEFVTLYYLHKSGRL